MAGKLSAIEMPAWMRGVEAALRALDVWRQDQVSVPVGGAVVWTSTRAVPAGWLTANGGTFDAAVYPELQDELGSTTLPNLTAVSGKPWIVRAE